MTDDVDPEGHWDMVLPDMSEHVATLRCFSDAQLAKRDAAIEARVRAEVADRDERIKAAVSRMRAVLIANCDLLDVPFTNEPALSPWTRSVKRALEALLTAVAAGSSPDTAPEPKP